MRRCIPDADILWLLGKVIDSFSSTRSGIGLPLGNLTSQLLVNICMNEFDQFVKHKLKIKHYVRYADDFMILSESKNWLGEQVVSIEEFLRTSLRLELHPDKVFIKSLASGVDFLGWAHFPDHKVLRTTTKRRMIKKIQIHPKPETPSSYFGLLSHGNTHKLHEEVLKYIASTNLS